MYGGRAVLDREMDAANPSPGDLIVIGRGKDGQGEKGAFHRYIVKSAPGEKPPQPSAAAPEADDGPLF